LLVPDDVAIRGYIAGLIDADGSIPFLNQHWCVKISMTDEPVIRWLHQFGAHFEAQMRHGASKQDGSPRKPIYTWGVHRRHDVIHLLTAVLPYLIVKKARAEKVLTEMCK